jgi:hypothetical protein
VVKPTIYLEYCPVPTLTILKIHIFASGVCDPFRFIQLLTFRRITKLSDFSACDCLHDIPVYVCSFQQVHEHKDVVCVLLFKPMKKKIQFTSKALVRKLYRHRTHNVIARNM